MLIRKKFFINIIIGFLWVHVIAQNDTINKSFYYQSGKLSSEGFMYKEKPVGYWKALMPKPGRKR